MSMSKKDYEAIARIINTAQAGKDDGDRDIATRAYRAAMNNTAKIVARDVAEYCAAQSATFDRARFLKACGVQE